MIQTNNYKYSKLVEYNRNGLIEQEHCGFVLHIDKKSIIKRIGDDNNYKFYHRSCMKPLQASLCIDLKLDEKYGFTMKELAVFAGSHCGDWIHQEKVNSALYKLGLCEDNLLLSDISPLSNKEKNRLLRIGLSSSKIHNNCSGKHVLMLAICKDRNYPTDNYTSLNHPLTNLVMEKIAELCEEDKKNIAISKDGCALPVAATSLFSLGKGYLNLFCNKKYEKLKQAFLKYPYLIGGDGRLDSEIINCSDNLIAKVGASGLCVVVNIEKEEAIVVKIADSDMNARAFVVISSLLQLKWLDIKKIKTTPLNSLFKKDIKTQTGEIIGKICECFSLV